MITDGLFFVVNFCMFDFFLVVSDNRHRRVRDQEDFTTRVSLVVVRIRGLPVELDTINHVSRFFAQFSQWLYAYVRIIRLHIADNALCPSLRAFRSGQKAVLCRTRLTPDEPMPTGVAGVGSGVQEQEKSMKVKRQELRFDKTEMSIHVRVYGK